MLFTNVIGRFSEIVVSFCFKSDPISDPVLVPFSCPALGQQRRFGEDGAAGVGQINLSDRRQRNVTATRTRHPAAAGWMLDVRCLGLDPSAQ